MWAQMMKTPLGRLVVGSVAAAAVSGVAFHGAMEHMLATRPEPTVRRRVPDSSSHGGGEGMIMGDPYDHHQKSSSGGGGAQHHHAPTPREEGQQQQREGGEEEEEEVRRRVRNQNENFRRFLRDLHTKDRAERLEEAAQGMQYFINPALAQQDARLKRIQHPTDDPPPEQEQSGSRTG